MNLHSEFESAFTPRSGDEGPGAPRLSFLALAALLAGLVSFMAMITPVLWPVAGAALLFCVLVKIYLAHNRGEVTGEALATIGLAVALVFAVAAPVRYAMRQWKVREQSADIGREWLMFLAGSNPEPYNAFESMRPLAMRRPLRSELEWQYAANGDEALQYRHFLNTPLVKALALLPRSVEVKVKVDPNEAGELSDPEAPNEASQHNASDKAEEDKKAGEKTGEKSILLPRPVMVRHYLTEQVTVDKDGHDVIDDVFAVTWRDEKDEPHSMFVRLEIERQTEHGAVGGLWQILKYEVIPRPAAK